MDYQAVAEIINRNSGLYTIITDKGREKKRIFLSSEGNVCEFAPHSRKRGYAIPHNVVENWRSIEEVQRNEADTVAKFRRYAARASFPSAFVRKCLAADTTKDCYENRLTTGTRIDGEIISLNAIERYPPYSVRVFRKALMERREYHSCRFDFRGYDGSLWIEIAEKDDNYYRKGDVKAGFNKEYRGCGNGYYYSLIDDEHFIGTDID